MQNFSTELIVKLHLDALEVCSLDHFILRRMTEEDSELIIGFIGYWNNEYNNKFDALSKSGA